MPPYQVDADSSNNDDWHCLPYDIDDDDDVKQQQLSPLFRDQHAAIRPSSPSRRLDKRQSDPEYAAAIDGGRDGAASYDDAGRRLGAGPSSTSTTTTTTAAVVSSTPPQHVSRITAIIGPESSYVKIPDGVVVSGGPVRSPQSLPSFSAASASPGETKQSQDEKSTRCDDGGGGSRSTLVRATRFVGKRGRRLVGYIPIRLASAFGTSGVGRDRSAAV